MLIKIKKILKMIIFMLYLSFECLIVSIGGLEQRIRVFEKFNEFQFNAVFFRWRKYGEHACIFLACFFKGI